MASLSVKEKKRIQKQIIHLRAEIERHDRLYYRDACPEISDFEYDCLKNDLRHLESLLPDIISSELVGNDHIDGLMTFKHYTRMLSLDNTYNLFEVEQFCNKIHDQIGSVEYVVEPKIDGVAVNLIYQNGKLIRALTRGDGTYGDDITDNVKTIETLPLVINTNQEILEVRGEIYISKKDFEIINRQQQLNGDESFANARNLVAGTVKLMDINEVKNRVMRIFLYDIGDGCECETQAEIYQFLKKNKFQIQENFFVVNSIEECKHAIEKIDLWRSFAEYMTDGAVIKVNNVRLQHKIGSTSRAPRWAFAYKFSPERVSTKLKSITVQVGRTGVITPVAELESVQLSGSTVSRATLHNFDEIETKDIREGDFVFIEKAGEIIPAVIGVDLSKRAKNVKKYNTPVQCPCCGSELIKNSDEVALRCVNFNCKEQIVQRLIYFCSINAMNIDGLGDSIIRQLVNLGVTTGLDILNISRETLYKLENFGEKSVNNILINIEKCKKNPLWRVINALGINLIGEKASKDIAKTIKTLEKFLSISMDTLLCIDGIGVKSAERVMSYLSRADNIEIIKGLIDLGIGVSGYDAKIESDNSLFKGKVFVLTGKLNEFSRNQAKEIIESHGGCVASSVSKTVNILIAGENSGRKLQDAAKYNITVWNEIDFREQFGLNI